MKTYRRFIRIGGELKASPKFSRKKDADDWYHAMRRNKQLLRDGLPIANDDDGVLFIDYAREWIKKRMAAYPASTWKSDEQRLRDYVLPILSELPLANITGAQIRNLLIEISKEGFLKPKFVISTSTRDRVKALLSAIFSDALNEDPPLVKYNPVLGIKIKEKRVGKKSPRVIEDSDGCIKFLKKAKELSPIHYAVSSTFLMAGIRKQELIALRWKSLKDKRHELHITEKYEQASNVIKRGTKRGEEVARVIPVPALLVSILGEYRSQAAYKKSEDFVFSKERGIHYGPREIWALIKEVGVAAKIDTHPHALRHTFGREFAANTGNLKALQSILGHASSATTDIYSDLAGSRLKGFGEAVTFNLGVKKSE